MITVTYVDHGNINRYAYPDDRGYRVDDRGFLWIFTYVEGRGQVACACHREWSRFVVEASE